jgi:hypothetical protein
MSTIKGYCTTNLDDYRREEWPTEFVAVPTPGQWVEAKSKNMLKVVNVTHKYDWMKKEPYILVDLTNSRHGATL